MGKYASERKTAGKPFSTASMVWNIENRNILERLTMATIAKLSGLSVSFLIRSLTTYFQDDTLFIVSFESAGRGCYINHL